MILDEEMYNQPMLYLRYQRPQFAVWGKLKEWRERDNIGILKDFVRFYSFNIISLFNPTPSVKRLNIKENGTPVTYQLRDQPMNYQDI